MFTSLRRAIASAIMISLTLAGLTATPSAAAEETLTVGSGLTVQYGQSVAVPFTFTSTSTELLTAVVDVTGGALDMQAYATAHSDVLFNNGGTTSSYLEVIGTAAQVTDFLANVRVKSRYNGNTKNIKVSASVYNTLGPNIDSGSGHGYEFIWNGGDFDTSLCRAKYVNSTLSYDEVQAPNGDHCYANGNPLVTRTYKGVTAHIAQPNSQAETTYLINEMLGWGYSFWLGASDADSDGHWKWVGGANDGIEFWTGDSTGTRVSGDHTPWAAGNPVATTGATDNTALLFNPGGQWSSADSTSWNYFVTEYDLPAGSVGGPYIYRNAETVIDVTGSPVDACLNVSDGLESSITVEGTGQSTRWYMYDVVNLSDGQTAKNLPYLLENDYENDADLSNVGFNHSYNGNTGLFDSANTCLVDGADGSTILRADSPNGYDLGNGLTVSYETKYFNDGATVRQSVTYTNTSGSTVNAGDVQFAGGYYNDDTRYSIGESAYGSAYAEFERGGVATYWGGDSTTVVNANKFAPLTSVDNTLWADLDNETARFNAWQNIPNAYLDGVAGTIANWGPNSVDIAVNSRPGTNSNADIVFSLGNIPAGQTRSLVVMTEVHNLGIILEPRWSSDSARGDQDVARGQEFISNYSLIYADGLYTYAVTSGALPTGLSLDTNTGVISGTTDVPVGEYNFEITATADKDWPELEDRTRSFTISVVDVVAGESFETGTFLPWNTITRQVDLGVTVIAGCQTVDTADYSGLEALSGEFEDGDRGVLNGQRGGTADNNVGDYDDDYGFEVGISSGEHTDGEKSLRLESDLDPVQYGYDVVRGPAVYSAEFNATTSQIYAFDWQAQNGSDAFAVFGYLLNVDTCAQTEVLDAVGEESDWAKAYVNIPANGTYRFVFVSGTYDESGGRAAGASLYLDNFQVGSPQAPAWTDEVVADGVVGTEYTNALTASGFPDPIVSLIGGSLPDGLSMDSHGNITGTPTAVGTYTFKVKADNGLGIIYTTATIHITNEPANDVYWSEKVLPLAYQAEVQVIDGVTAVMPGTITYSVINSSLPAGLTLNPATGALTGAPTTEGNFYFTIQATNGEDTLTWTYAGLIAAAPENPPAPFVAPANGKYKWSRNNTTITWDASAQAVRYVVKWRNFVICETLTPNCVASGRVPNDRQVTITAYNRAGNSLTGDATFVPSTSRRLGVTPLFATNSATLTAGDKAKLKSLATYLKNRNISKLLLIGYTDVTGPAGVDPGLSLSRAKAVKAYLGKFMSVKNVTIKGLGRLYPAKSNKTAAGRAANRRVEIWVR